MAGIIGYCKLNNDDIALLFHEMLPPSKKCNHFVDCGGGGKDGESKIDVAGREFSEETMGIYSTISTQEVATVDEHIASSIQHIKQIIMKQQEDNKLIKFEGGWGSLYTIFLVPVEYIDAKEMTSNFDKKYIDTHSDQLKCDAQKKRLFHWLSASQLLCTLSNDNTTNTTNGDCKSNNTDIILTTKMLPIWSRYCDFKAKLAGAIGQALKLEQCTNNK